MDLFSTKNRIDDINFDLLSNQYNSEFDKRYIEHTVITSFFDQYGGTSYNEGIFKIHSKSSAFYWTSIITDFFPKYKERICPFAFDWMGRQFALNINSPDTIYMFDPATGEDFVLEQSMYSFLNEELVTFRDETLIPDDFAYAMNKLNKKVLMPNECIGYTQYLFLGGEDSLENTEVTDMDVYWSLNYQIYCKIHNLPADTKIGNIDITDKQ